ncbi:MAG: glycogen synthase GlgA [Anaerovorax sp.]
MNILFVSTEASPFAKSGGLGDVVGSLPKALNNKDIEVRVILPLYKSIKERYQDELLFLGEFQVSLSWRNPYCGIFQMEYEGVTFYFVDNEQYFNRDAYYGYFDDGERFAYFSKAVLDSLPYMDFKPDILHCSDWESALVPVYLKTLFKHDERYATLKTVFTIHNIEYQGRFDGAILMDVLGIPEVFRSILDYKGDVNYMKGAVVTCDKLTTVSPSYAEEITYPFYGRGLEGIIKENEYKLCGILNGIDTKLFNPTRDKTIASKYSKSSPEKKVLNKLALQRKLGFEEDEKIPMIGMIGRLVAHKGIDLVENVFDEIMAEKVQLVVLGSGEPKYENFFDGKAMEYSGKMAMIKGFSGGLANEIYAGADLFLMPSLSEPCGLAQMISARYGTISIVRQTGGLQDSILPYNPITKEGNGITFISVNAHDMLGAIKRAIALYWDKPNWKILMQNAFKTDFSWKKSSLEYIRIYEELLQEGK